MGYRTPAEVFYGQHVDKEKDLTERRRPGQPVLVSYVALQESRLIVD